MRITRDWWILFSGIHNEKNQWCSKWCMHKCIDKATLYLLPTINRETLLGSVTFANYQGIMQGIVLHRDPFFQILLDLPLGVVEEEDPLEMDLQGEELHFLLEGEGEEEEEINKTFELNMLCNMCGMNLIVLA